jgi:hypothetical protein
VQHPTSLVVLAANFLRQQELFPVQLNFQPLDLILKLVPVENRKEKHLLYTYEELYSPEDS